MDLDALLLLAADHKWFALAAVVVGALVRSAKSEAFPFFSELPPLWKRIVPLMLGGIAGALESLATGRPTTEAIVKGLILAGGGAMIGHDALIEGVRGGREVG